MEKATTHGLDKTSSNNVWEVFEKGASYGFNFSHALTYGRWMYISAWIKYYFPEIFYAVSLINDIKSCLIFLLVLRLARRAQLNGLHQFSVLRHPG